jgi:dTDP-4-amino-4,6-dideoxygalactose transaminase
METADLDKIEMPGVQTRLTSEEEQALLKVLREGNSLATGSEGEAFEREFADFIGCPDAVAVSSCSAALELAAILSGLESGDEVIIPAHTFCATAVPFGRTGATIRWADIDPDTRLISAASIRSLITDRTKAVVIVHLYGLVAEMDGIMAVADEHDIVVIEDSAQAPGARYNGRRAGAIGHFGCFSFHSHKNMTTLGEGGMLTVRNPADGVTARQLRWMGNWPFARERENYWQPAMGDIIGGLPEKWPVNFCMGEPNAAVGRLLLQRLDAINATRQAQATRFKGGLADFPELSFQAVPAGCEHVYHLMAARYDGAAYGRNHDDLIGLLHEKYALKTLVQYWPLNRTHLFQHFDFGEADLPATDFYYDNMISFPWFSEMPESLIDDMADRTRQALTELRP